MRQPSQLQYFKSGIDGQLCPYAVCATDASDARKPLVVEVSPGALDNLPRSLAQAEEIVDIAAGFGRSCVAIRPTGRGGGSVYQNYGEVDVLEAIEHVCSCYPIDRDRISLTGTSMGGAAVWYLASHYPDLFAAAAPFDGYCDYRLWEKPGGHTFQLHDWEVPSWQSRSAACIVESLASTPVWMTQGEWDRAVGGGVDVEHSRQMARLMAERAYPHKYTELAGVGHGSRLPEPLREVVGWLLEQRKERNRASISLATYGLRHNRSDRATILQLARYGEKATLTVDVAAGDRVEVRTAGVRTFRLEPRSNAPSLPVFIDGQKLGPLDLRQPQMFRICPDGTWAAGEVSLSAEKRPSSSGPIGDMFFDRTILVPGTTGSEEQTYFNNWVASNAQSHYKTRNGGVHRGGILGVNVVELPIVNDQDLAPELLNDSNLLLYGNDRSNGVLAALKANLPIEFRRDAICIGKRTFEGNRVAAIAVFPHPANPSRYVAIHGGVTPDAIAWGSHLDMNLLPDYLVYCEGKVLEWGFFGNDWWIQGART